MRVGVLAALALCGCTTTSINGVTVSDKRTAALAGVSIVGIAMLLAAERSKSREQLPQGHPEHGCPDCGIERAPID